MLGISVLTLEVHLANGSSVRGTSSPRREVGGGFEMGDTCTPVANSCQYMAKTTAVVRGSTLIETAHPGQAP